MLQTPYFFFSFLGFISIIHSQERTYLVWSILYSGEYLLPWKVNYSYCELVDDKRVSNVSMRLALVILEILNSVSFCCFVIKSKYFYSVYLMKVMLIFFFCSTMFLMGPIKQLKRMFELTRLIATIIMLVSNFSFGFLMTNENVQCSILFV